MGRSAASHSRTRTIFSLLPPLEIVIGGAALKQPHRILIEFPPFLFEGNDHVPTQFLG
jgi:hypothetical protein